TLRERKPCCIALPEAATARTRWREWCLIRSGISTAPRLPVARKVTASYSSLIQRGTKPPSTLFPKSRAALGRGQLLSWILTAISTGPPKMAATLTAGWCSVSHHETQVPGTSQLGPDWGTKPVANWRNIPIALIFGYMPTCHHDLFYLEEVTHGI